MWYRVAKYSEDKKFVERKFVDSRVLADMVANNEQFDIETKNAWLEGVVKEFDENFSDGEVLEEVIKLIDEGECYA